MKRTSLASILLFAFATVSAGPGRAQPACPTGDDLEGGIRLTQVEPTISSLIHREFGLYRETRVDLSSETARIREFTRPHYLFLPNETGENEIVIETSSNLEGLDRLASDPTFRASLQVSTNGAPTEVMGYEVDFLWVDRTRLGACTYTIWNVIARLTNNGEVTEFVMEYVPALGVLLAFEGPAQTVRYDAITFD